MRIPWPHALRDTTLLGVTFALWSTEAVARGDGLASMGAGVLAALCGYLAHEWGHLGGALLSRSTIHLPRHVWATFLFNFDSDRNRREQFLAMSFGGFLASAAVVAGFLAWLPRDALAGQLALGLTALGVAATVLLEFPPTWRVARGAPIPRGLGYHAEDVGVAPPS